MKRYLRGFVAIVATLAFMGGVANAQEGSGDCSGDAIITHTGPDSVNKIECVSARDIKVTCKNNIYVVTDNSQSAGSGDTTNDGNTTGGSAISGNATNENGTIVEIGASCGEQPAVITPENPKPGMGAVTPSSQQPSGGGGAVAPTQAPVEITTLPDTSSNPILDGALIAGSSLTGLLIASQLSIAAYRRFALR